jgi:hypothetical protein
LVRGEAILFQIFQGLPESALTKQGVLFLGRPKASMSAGEEVLDPFKHGHVPAGFVAG